MLGVGDVVVLDLPQNLGVDAHLLVGGILFVAGMDAEPAELAQDVTRAEGGEDRDGDGKNETLEDSGHTHHRERPKGEPATYIHDRRNTGASGVLGAKSRAGVMETNGLGVWFRVRTSSLQTTRTSSAGKDARTTADLEVSATGRGICERT